MAKVKQPLEENGIHRAKMWEIMMYALNNTSTNTYMMVVGYISYFLIGIVGLASVLAGSIVTIMRIWDGVTDPFVGMMVDKTNGKFGKNRPFIVIGQIIMFVTTFVMFNFIPKMGTGVRFVAFIIIYMIYILGYTCQCVVTKSAQTCLTNDPKQRPIFAMCDTVYNIILMNIVIPVIVTDSLVPKFTLTAENNAAEIASLVAQNPALAGIVEKSGGSLSAFYNPGLFTTMQLMFGGLSAVFAVCAIIALWRKDNSKYFGLGTAQKVGVKDYVDTLAHNRAIQMLVVSASTDKLFMSTMSNSTVMICLFGIIFGNYAAFSSYSQITSIPIALISILLMNKIARQMGQKASMMTGTYGGIIGSIIAIRYIFRVNLAKEEDELKNQDAEHLKHKPHLMSLEVRNESINGKTLVQVKDFLGRSFVCSRIRHEGHVNIPNHETLFHMGDQVFIVCSEEDAEAITAFIGKEVQVDWEKQDMPMVSRRILITKSEINGKKLGDMHFRGMFGVNVTRVNRSGMDLFADPHLTLQVGDRGMEVG